MVIRGYLWLFALRGTLKIIHSADVKSGGTTACRVKCLTPCTISLVLKCILNFHILPSYMYIYYMKIDYIIYTLFII